MGKIKRFERCPYCESWIPRKYLNAHLKVCLVKRGLKNKPGEEGPGETLIAKPGESIQDLLNRARKK